MTAENYWAIKLKAGNAAEGFFYFPYGWARLFLTRDAARHANRLHGIQGKVVPVLVIEASDLPGEKQSTSATKERKGKP